MTYILLAFISEKKFKLCIILQYIYISHNLYCQVEQPSLVILVLISVFTNFTMEKMQTKVVASEIINDNM